MRQDIFWYFSFDSAPDFTVTFSASQRKGWFLFPPPKVRVEVGVKSERKPSSEELEDWVEALSFRSAHHMADGELREFKVLNDLMEKLDAGA